VAIRLKTPEEIQTLREGGRRLWSVLQTLAKEVKPGVSAAALDRLAETLLTADGGKPPFKNYKAPGSRKAFPACICISINEEIVHGAPLESKIFKAGDVVKVDAGLTWGGLITDAAVTVIVPPVDPERARLVKATRDALDAAIRVAKPGVRVGEISAAIERVALRAGFTVVKELAGHGVGFGLHEDPYVPNEGTAKEGPILEVGAVIAIEPIFSTGGWHLKVGRDGFALESKDGSVAAQSERTVAIVEGGCLVLTAR
jgi:methionyl aminopeptidase